MTDAIVLVKPETLSDGSRAFNVTVRDAAIAHAITFPACSERDAYAMAEKIRDAINEHTVFVAELRDVA